jgi:hypothetical protein
MAEVTIRFRNNAKTGKRELVITYESESDALQHEHERDHRKLVESVLGVPVTEEMGDIVVERIVKKGEAREEAADEAVGEKKAEKQGS